MFIRFACVLGLMSSSLKACLDGEQKQLAKIILYLGFFYGETFAQHRQICEIILGEIGKEEIVRCELLQ